MQWEIHIPRGTEELNVGPYNLHRRIKQLGSKSCWKYLQSYQSYWRKRNAVSEDDAVEAAHGQTSRNVGRCIEVGEIIQSCLPQYLWDRTIFFSLRRD